MSVYLKVKAKSLAEEAKIIRLERRKAKARARKLRLKYGDNVASRGLSSRAWSLHSHGFWVVKREARATHLARNFLKGTPYRVVEKTTKPDKVGPDWDAVQRMATKYGELDPRETAQRLEEWKSQEAA